METINYQTSPVDNLQGELRVPSDKSISHRALILGAIAKGQTTIHQLLFGTDNLATLNVLRALNVNIKINDSVVQIYGVGLQGLQAPTVDLDFENSGTGLRLMAGLLAGQKFSSRLIGDESLNRRPMRRIINPLQQMGAHITATPQDTPPLTIHAVSKLQGIGYQLPVASAQVKSCLLLAGLYAEGETIITEPHISRDHTERMLKAFKCQLDCCEQRITLKGGQQLQATEMTVPADISSAAFFIVAASITPGSSIVLREVGVNPTRTGLIEILLQMGADIRLHNLRKLGAEPVADIEINYAPLRGIEILPEWVPLAIDEFPVILIAAASAEGETLLTKAHELRVKETDRITAMAMGLQALGIEVEVFADGIKVRGGQITGGQVDSFGDHRIAMAFSVAGCVASESITIKNCANVTTSFPNFIEFAQGIGIKVKIV